MGKSIFSASSIARDTFFLKFSSTQCELSDSGLRFTKHMNLHFFSEGYNKGITLTTEWGGWGPRDLENP